MTMLLPFSFISFETKNIELGTDEESGKDWSDLEREAAEDDKNYGKDDYLTATHKNKKSSHDRDRNHRDKNKSSKNHR